MALESLCEVEEHAAHVSKSYHPDESNISELHPCFERTVSSFLNDLNFIFILTHFLKTPMSFLSAKTKFHRQDRVVESSCILPALAETSSTL